MKPLSNSKKEKIRTPFSTKEVLIFLFFVCISLVLWILTALSHTHESEIQFKIKYSSIPLQYSLIDSLPTNVTATVKDVGFHLLFRKMSKKDSLPFDITNRFISNKKHFTLHEKDIRNIVSEKLNSTATIVQILPREIQVNYSEQTHKTLPVKLTGSITLAQQHTFSGSIRLQPSQVQVYGPAAVLDTMAFIYTKQLNLSNLSDTTYTKTSLFLHNNITPSTTMVKVTIPVEQFTEKIVSVPIMGINFPKGLQLRTFPAMVSVSFFVGLSHFEEVNEDDLTVYLDYDQMLKSNNGKEKVTVRTTDSLISNIKATPAVVEYIFEKSGK